MPDLEVGREKPKCVTTVICESIIEDKFTDKRTLVGLFNDAGFASLPAGLTIAILGSFADGRGQWRLNCRVRDPKQQVVFNAEGDLNFASPLETYDVAFRVVNLPVVSEGVYDVDFLIDNDPIGHRHFRVHLL